MALIPDEIIEEIRSRADILDVVGETTTLKRTGRTFRGPCPLHGGEGPNFSVDPAKGFFKCHVCQQGGTAFDFLMQKYGMTFPDAARTLAERFGVTIPEEPQEERKEDPHEHFYQINDLALKFFTSRLHDSPALEYMVEQRGFDSALLEEHEVGYAPEGWTNLLDYMKRHGIPVHNLITLGLVRQKKNDETQYIDVFRDRLIFPIRDVRGRLVAFAGRVLPGAPDDMPKYVNSPESPIYTKGRHLYGLHRAKGEIRRTGRAVVMEGYLDWLRMWSIGIQNVVAGSGTALTESQARMIARYAGEAVTLYDSDGTYDVLTDKGTGGYKASFAAADRLIAEGVWTRVGQLPAGEDPDSFARGNAVEGVQAVIDRAGDVFEVKAGMLRGMGYFDTLTGTERAFDLLIPMVRAVSDPVKRALYVRRLAEYTGVSPVSVEMEAAGDGQPASFTEQQMEASRAGLAAAVDAVEKFALRWTQNDGGQFDAEIAALVRQVQQPDGHAYHRYVRMLEERADTSTQQG